jgi:hypothetical protein
MRTLLAALLNVISGALGGAVGLSLLTVLLYALLEVSSFQDGQFVTVFVFTVPFGAVIGGAIAVVRRVARSGHVKVGGWLAVVAGALVLTLASVIIWGSAGSRGGGAKELLNTWLSLWIAPSWFAGVALFTWGARLIAAHRVA